MKVVFVYGFDNPAVWALRTANLKRGGNVRQVLLRDVRAMCKAAGVQPMWLSTCNNIPKRGVSWVYGFRKEEMPYAPHDIKLEKGDRLVVVADHNDGYTHPQGSHAGERRYIQVAF